MKKLLIVASSILGTFSLFLTISCNQPKTDVVTPVSNASDKEAALPEFAGYESQAKWGEHLVKIGGCHDCHTPKKMGPKGPEIDYSLALSGHPAGLPPIDINRNDVEKKGLVVTNDLTAWVGPWGVSYAANLTPDDTGLGSWKEDQFMYAIRNGVSKGLPGSRPLLPPMPWDMFKEMTDGELKAIFAYLKSIPAINNLVPAPLPPVSAK
jgi:hypothetical protein